MNLYTQMMDRFNSTEKEARTDNSGFKKCRVTWANQVQFFNQNLVLGDSFVLRNPALLKSAKHWHQG